MGNIINRFFVEDDKCINKLVFSLEPKFWWSRRYEYPFALSFVEANDTVLDVACGVEHPFKFHLANMCSLVFACDLEDVSYNKVDKMIKYRFGDEAKLFNKQMYDMIKINSMDMTQMLYKDKYFDKIFCISALEHLGIDIVKQGLQEMKRCLKDDGRIILTLDFPTKHPQEIIDIVNEVGLHLDGKYDYSLPKDGINSTYFGEPKLYCYSMVLKKIN